MGVITHSASLISACEKGNRWEQALQRFELMQAQRLTPKLNHYNA